MLGGPNKLANECRFKILNKSWVQTTDWFQTVSKNEQFKSWLVQACSNNWLMQTSCWCLILRIESVNADASRGEEVLAGKSGVRPKSQRRERMSWENPGGGNKTTKAHGLHDKTSFRFTTAENVRVILKGNIEAFRTFYTPISIAPFICFCFFLMLYNAPEPAAASVGFSNSKAAKSMSGLNVHFGCFSSLSIQKTCL